MKKYNVILADPPWAYHVWSKKGVGRTAENHYNSFKSQQTHLDNQTDFGTRRTKEKSL